MLATEQMITLAMERLGINRETALRTCTAVDGIPGAFFFSRGTRGGGRVLINSGYETLFASSAVSLEEHEKAFLAGRRN